MLYSILEANGGIPNNAVVTFQNTGREMPQTLDFVNECADRWNCPITWLERPPRKHLTNAQLDLVARHLGHAYANRLESWWQVSQAGFQSVSHNSAARSGEPLLALILARKYLPNQQARFCTVECKVRVAKAFLRSLGWDYWTNCVGLRADEPRRLKPEGVKLNGDRWSVWQPLANAKIGKHDVAAFWEKQPFDLALPNIKGNCWLGNCDGCFLKSEANLAAFSRDYPDRHLWWEGLEAIATELTSGSAAHWSKRYSRSELRKFMERQGDWALSTEGALCQADDGECMA